MRGSRKIGARDSSLAAGVFGGLDVHRAAGGAGQARTAKRSNGRLGIVENMITNAFPLR